MNEDNRRWGAGGSVGKVHVLGIGPAFQVASLRHLLFYLRADGKLKYAKVQDAMDVAMHNKVHMVGMVGEQTPGTTSTIKGDIVATPGGKK